MIVFTNFPASATNYSNNEITPTKWAFIFARRRSSDDRAVIYSESGQGRTTRRDV